MGVAQQDVVIPEFEDTLVGLPDETIQRIFDGQPFAEPVVISPAMAQAWLGRNLHNRTKKRYVINQIQWDIKHGHWGLTGQTIIVSTEGVLLDGQNRLTAIAQGGRPVHSFVAWNIEPGAFAKIDKGGKRSLADTLGIRQTRYASRVGAAARFIMGATQFGLERWVVGRGGAWNDLSEQRVLEWLEQETILLRVTHAVEHTLPASKFVSGAAVSGLCYFCAQRDQRQAEIFYDALGTGADLAWTSPIYHLRERLLAIKREQIKRRPFDAETVIAIVHAWNLFRAGREIRQLKTGSLQSFPEIR